MKYTFFFGISLIAMFTILFSCAPEKKQSDYKSYIDGQAHPILMNVGHTRVYLDDYFEPPVEIDSITANDRLRVVHNDRTRTLDLSNKGNLPAFSLIEFYVQGDRIDIPVLRSKKKAHMFVYKPGDKKYNSLKLVGDMNAWNPADGELKFQNGMWTKVLQLVPGVYAYQLEADGERILDDTNPLTMDNGSGGTNSKLVISGTPEDRKPQLSLVSANSSHIVVETKNAAVVTAMWNNQHIRSINKNDMVEITIPEIAESVERSYIRIWTHTHEEVSNYVLVPLDFGEPIMDTKELNRNDPRTNIMYFVMVDRFNNGNTQNDHTVDDPEIKDAANFQGGDLQGITAKIKDGYFEDLGVNNIWLSPIVKNAEGAYGYYNQGGITSKFAAYHGYWPVSFTKVTPYFGGENALEDLISTAHKKEYNMTLDFVANHVHENHPVYQANKNNGWFTDLYLPDSTLNTEKWDEHRLTTWFDVFLPTLNLEKQNITEMLSDSAVYWIENYDFDYFRHDATKHIPENFWRTLTKKVKKYERTSGKEVIQLGETYGTPELINSYIGTGMLDGQFDFNVYDALTASICREDVGMNKAADRIKQSQLYYGTNHIMGNITGNQDRARFMAYATGDISFDEDSKYAGWSRTIDKKSPEGYAKLAILHVINMTIPGIPVIYYGDEIGMTGGNDPDNRRMMYFDNWTDAEQDLFNTVSTAAKLRRNEMSLMYGDLKFLQADQEILAFERNYFDQHAIVLINNSNEPQQLKLNLEEMKIPDAKAAFGHSFTLDEYGILTVELPAFSFEIIHN